ncbi:pyridoxal phosphate-dependent aminotransferase [Oceanivirga miroungae]|uniref:Aminotransferase n=1 Tax=Oceanivirga miroungae TaxID=1130046 RepID=A0A6I8MF75_9FUSO|nr:aminotransferase class I/II-fold pyridoxal phosphate-dependent enzyme [Oceanivirga miroungae]VWL85736.1 hypothetical protein OMES3154_01024 [Oceanivirga miroungae]
MREVVKKLEVSKIRQIAIKMRSFDDGINFTIGEPSQDVPQVIKDEMINRIKTQKLGYTATGGMPELRKEIPMYYNKLYMSNYNEKECIVTVGATEGIAVFSRSVLTDGDEVIIPLPAYPGYEPNILMEGAKPVYIDTESNGFRVTSDMIEKHITDKTRAIILTYPNNPTGLVLGLDEMDKIVDLLKRYPNIQLLCDEIYAQLSFEKFNSFARYTDMKDRITIISGFSKSHSMTGYRIGYMLSSEENIKNYVKVSQYTTTGIATVSQYGAIVAMNKCLDRSDVVSENKKRVEYMAEKLTELGFDVIKPAGAFYLFASYKKLSSKNSVDFCEEILENTHVGIVPGICFNVENHVRLSVTHNKEVLDEAIRRIAKYLGE